MLNFITKITVIAIIIIIISSGILLAERVHRVKSGEHLYVIAKEYGVTVKEIISLNNLRFPDQIYQRQVLIIPDRSWPGVYRVKTDDTLRKISRQLRIPVEILCQYNKISRHDFLYPDQLLKIPYRYLYPQNYVVEKGDTLYKISRKFNLPIDEIAYFNNINNNSILEQGSKLKIPRLKPYNSQPDHNYPNYKAMFPDTFYLNGSTGDYKVALTFDDGPDELYTPEILDVLKKYREKATFFLIGERAKKYPEIVKRIVKEGHIIGNHTWSHINMTRISDKRLRDEIFNTEQVLNTSLTDGNSDLLRPPYGAVSRNVLQKAREMGYKVIYWSVDSRDWIDRDVDQILINTLPAVRKDSIILFHSAGGENHNLSSTVKVLPELIETLRMEGYKLVGLDELLNL